MRKRPFLIFLVAGVSLLYLAGLIYYAHARPIDGDEGFYTTAARLVWEGKAPYRDFFYQQAPLLPYLYSWIWAIRPHSLMAMRTLSATCGGLAVLLWGLALLSAPRLPTKVALTTFAVVALNPYWVSWNVVVKTYAVANLLMTVVMVTLDVAFRSGRARWFFVTGLALGACASVRSLYAPLAAALAIWLLDRELRGKLAPARNDLAAPDRRFHRSLIGHPSRTTALVGGVGCGLLPMFYSFARGPGAFFFNNVRYHSLDAGYLWAGKQLVTGYQSLWHTSLVYFANIVVSLFALHPYFTAEVVLALIGAVAVVRLRSYEGQRRSNYCETLYFQATLLMLVGYAFVALIPFPPYDQYFDGPLVPFLIPFVAEGLRVAFRSSKLWVLGLAAATPFLFMTGIKTERSGVTSRPEWSLNSYRQVTEAVEANSAPLDVVLSFWPGYVFESGRQYFPDLEDNFVYRIMAHTTSDEKARFHVVSHEQIMAGISECRPAILVIHPWIIEYNQNLSQAQIQSFREAVAVNYSLVSNFDGVEVYTRRAGNALRH